MTFPCNLFTCCMWHNTHPWPCFPRSRIRNLSKPHKYRQELCQRRQGPLVLPLPLPFPLHLPPHLPLPLPSPLHPHSCKLRSTRAWLCFLGSRTQSVSTPGMYRRASCQRIPHPELAHQPAPKALIHQLVRSRVQVLQPHRQFLARLCQTCKWHSTRSLLCFPHSRIRSVSKRGTCQSLWCRRMLRPD